MTCLIVKGALVEEFHIIPIPNVFQVLLHTSPSTANPENQSRCSIVVSIPACHAGDPGSIPGSGDKRIPLFSIVK
ncbi:unnamed protein product [Sphagnum troendelagicum]